MEIDYKTLKAEMAAAGFAVSEGEGFTALDLASHRDYSHFVLGRPAVNAAYELAYSGPQAVAEPVIAVEAPAAPAVDVAALLHAQTQTTEAAPAPAETMTLEIAPAPEVPVAEPKVEDAPAAPAVETSKEDPPAQDPVPEEKSEPAPEEKAPEQAPHEPAVAPSDAPAQEQAPEEKAADAPAADSAPAVAEDKAAE